jgi:hypothetical protein
MIPALSPLGQVTEILNPLVYIMGIRKSTARNSFYKNA